MDDKWAERAHYDLDTAQAMFEAGRNLYVLFCCQQAVEKMLKALIVRRTGQFPPRVHQLMRLADAGSVRVDAQTAAFLRELSGYYIPTRYPGEAPDPAVDVKREEASRILNQTREFMEWLNSTSQ